MKWSTGERSISGWSGRLRELFCIRKFLLWYGIGSRSIFTWKRYVCVKWVFGTVTAYTEKPVAWNDTIGTCLLLFSRIPIRNLCIRKQSHGIRRKWLLQLPIRLVPICTVGIVDDNVIRQYGLLAAIDALAKADTLPPWRKTTVTEVPSSSCAPRCLSKRLFSSNCLSGGWQSVGLRWIFRYNPIIFCAVLFGIVCLSVSSASTSLRRLLVFYLCLFWWRFFKWNWFPGH